MAEIFNHVFNSTSRLHFCSCSSLRNKQTFWFWCGSFVISTRCFPWYPGLLVKSIDYDIQVMLSRSMCCLFLRIPEFCGLLLGALRPTGSSPSSFQPHRYKKNNVKGLFSLLHIFLTYHWSYLSAGCLGHTIPVRFEMTAKVNKVIWPLGNSTSSANLTSYGEQPRYIWRTPPIYYPQNNDPDKFLFLDF